ncbi:MAG: VWA domain-containing protein, partial [Woeseiaceae bacterium]
MLTGFFFMLRQGGLKPSITEWLTLLDAMGSGLAAESVEQFYYLARSCLVKDETLFDRFDRIFAAHFRGMEDAFASLVSGIPDDWLRRQTELHLSEEERREIEALGGLDKLMEALRERLAEQQERHEGGNKWIGTAGTSPFGAYGYNPDGVRIGQAGTRHRRAVKVWDRREYRNLDDTVELGTRNIKIALRKLRKFAREGAPDELDLEDTIDKTARNAGFLDLRM